MTELTKAFLRPRIRVGREYVTKAQTKEQVGIKYRSSGMLATKSFCSAFNFCYYYLRIRKFLCFHQ